MFSLLQLLTIILSRCERLVTSTPGRSLCLVDNTFIRIVKEEKVNVWLILIRGTFIIDRNVDHVDLEILFLIQRYCAI